MGMTPPYPNNCSGSWLIDSSESFNLNLLPPASSTSEGGGGNLTEAVCQLTDMAVTLADRAMKLRDQIMLVKSVDHSHGNDRPRSAGHEEHAQWKRKRALDQANDHSVDDFMVNYKSGRDNGGNSPDESSEIDGFCCKRAKLLHAKPKALKILVRTQQSNTSLVVQDGYHWRKYGQKVTRDNPSPRAYFKCSYAPICPVKKKVQKSVEDPSVLVVTYHGEHNHKKPSDSGSILTIDTVESSSNNNNNKIKVNEFINPHNDNQIHTSASPALATPDLIDVIHDPRQRGMRNGFISATDSHDHQVNQQQKLLLEQIALSLAKEPYFATALAAAVSGKMHELQ